MSSRRYSSRRDTDDRIQRGRFSKMKRGGSQSRGPRTQQCMCNQIKVESKPTTTV